MFQIFRFQIGNRYFLTMTEFPESLFLIAYTECYLWSSTGFDLAVFCCHIFNRCLMNVASQQSAFSFDDTFVILSKYAARSFLGYINKTTEAIQSTVGSENGNGELPFLNCFIMRNPDGTLDTTVYRKPTNTGRYLNFHSGHSSTTKQGFIKGPFLRAERLYSTPDLLKTVMVRIY